MKSEIQEFYNEKSVFLTGGSGFLGKVFIEKLLRATDVKCIYILIRAKKGKSIDERIDDMFKNPLFESLLKLKPHARQRVLPIVGDCQLADLGISAQDRQTLIEEVQVVVHSAATVRFNEPLYDALAINVRATLDLIRLAKQMRKLQAFVHVSSAFANCTVFHIDEIFYANELSVSAESICKAADLLGAEVMNRLSSELCGKSPNTYTFTKALAEEAVLTHGKELPICIFRPGIVIPTCSEPVVGWVDNMYGPMSILFGVAHGVLRILYMRNNANANFVPVDLCVNLMAATAYNTAKRVNQCVSIPAHIYNFVPDERNMLKWRTYRRTVEEHGPKMPLTKMVWFPFAIAVESKLLYNVLILLYHIIPGYIFDLMLLLLGKKRRMVETYRKIHKQTGVLDYFVEHEWTFATTNTQQLWQSLNATDRSLFNFNMLDLQWYDYLYNSLLGMRQFLGKEAPETIPKGKKLLHRLLILHRAVQFVVYGGGSALLSWTFLRAYQSF